MPLQHDYRPSKWDEVVGNISEIKALRAALDRTEKARPHVFLFKGPGGVGKTSCARLVREHLACDDMNYTIVEPGKGGVDMVRDLKRTVRLRPSGGCPVRVWHMEECHRLTSAAQEDLLPILEEPPDHAFFTLATTEPQKLKPTFLRRCHVVNLAPLTDRDIAGLLKDVWKSERDEAIPEGLFGQISDAALGSPGVALKLLDGVIDLDPADMLEAVERKAEQEQEAFAICKMLVYDRAPWKRIAPVLKQLREQGEDPEGIRRLMMRAAMNSLFKGSDKKAGELLLELRDNPTYDGGWESLVATCWDVASSG